MVNKSHLRELVLRPAEGCSPTTDHGMTDSSLFVGKNTLHLEMDPQTSLWSFRYKTGGLPQPLKGKHTSYLKAYKYAEEYFKRRKVVIKEVID
jgi:hypothetical protein